MEGCRRPKEAVMLRCSGADAAPALEQLATVASERLRSAEGRLCELQGHAVGKSAGDKGWGRALRNRLGATPTSPFQDKPSLSQTFAAKEAENSVRAAQAECLQPLYHSAEAKQGVGRAHEKSQSVKSSQRKKTIRIGKRKRKLAHRRFGTFEASLPPHVYEENGAKVLTPRRADEGGILRHNHQISDLWLKNESRPEFHGAGVRRQRAGQEHRGKGTECVGELEQTVCTRSHREKWRGIDAARRVRERRAVTSMSSRPKLADGPIGPLTLQAENGRQLDAPPTTSKLSSTTVPPSNAIKDLHMSYLALTSTSFDPPILPSRRQKFVKTSLRGPMPSHLLGIWIHYVAAGPGHRLWDLDRRGLQSRSFEHFGGFTFAEVLAAQSRLFLPGYSAPLPILIFPAEGGHIDSPIFESSDSPSNQDLGPFDLFFASDFPIHHRQSTMFELPLLYIMYC
ncbi:hypothetical protein DFH09DRAFT_1094854 [Mycena vulgaris]|nr:hypothetical protein DFH09DRAFT_1094854 [Mycena vulgaris]